MLVNETVPEFSAATWPEIFNFSYKKHVVWAVSAGNQSFVNFVFSPSFSNHLVLANGPFHEFGAAIGREIFNF